MKKFFSFLILFIFAVQTHSSSAQTLNNIKLNKQIDTLWVFPAIGVIKCYINGKLTPDDSLSLKFEKNLSQILPHTAKFKIVYLDKNYELSDSLKKYFVSIIPRFSKMTSEVFSEIYIGDDFSKMIAAIPGNYIGVIFFDGFENYYYSQQIVQSFAVALATAALTGGMYYAYPVPEKPYFITDVLIIDKSEKRFLYYKRRMKSGSPLSNENIEKNYTKIFENYTKN